MLLFCRWTGCEYDSLPRGGITASVKNRPSARRLQRDDAWVFLPARHFPTRRKGLIMKYWLSHLIAWLSKQHDTNHLTCVFLMQLFVNDAQMNSSDILSGKGVIHGLSAVLQINRNRCDDLKYTKVMVRSSATSHVLQILQHTSVPPKTYRQ